MSTIIFINGTSSSGKTSLIKALQTKLHEPYLDMGIDRFIWMLPKWTKSSEKRINLDRWV